MRASRSLIGRVLSAGTIVTLVAAAGIVAGPFVASALPPQKPCGKTT